jgi:F0F1-type ATP synthase delta subunit
MPDETNSSGLPAGIISPSGVNQLIREIAKLDEVLTQAEVKKEQLDLKVKDISPDLHDFLRLNKLDILKTEDRNKGASYLNLVAAKAPVVHLSFAANPSSDVSLKLSSWFRSNVHPLTLIVVGLVPDIGAGCIVRTNNKVFDFTLKTRLNQSKQSLISKLRQAPSATAANP